jgi:tetraprenyl-beta-curcumene synthase
VRTSGRDGIAVLVALGAYQGRVVPQVRREVDGWHEVAAVIPDPVLRSQAIEALRQKALNVEATAVFATLAPRSNRAAAIRAMVALQVAIDYLDVLSEQPSSQPLENSLRLHGALTAAMSPGARTDDWYRLHPRGEDGGYLGRLVATCQESVAALPSHAAALPLVRRAAARCGEGQSHTHATKLAGDARQPPAEPKGSAAAPAGDPLRAWASSLDAPPVYRWWEVAAGASSSVAAHALIAAAADPATTATEAALIDAAYFPSIGALTVLLDDLIDRDEDAAGGEHNYLDYYAGSADAANRLELIAHLARAATAKLRHPHRHAAILAGVAGFYLSAAEAQTPYARPVRDRLLHSTGAAVRPIVAVMRLRRKRKRPEGAGSTSGP